MSTSSNGRALRKNINLAKVKRLHETFAQRMIELEMELEAGDFEA